MSLRRKWTLRAGEHKVVFSKSPNESAEHVLMKAFLWALYLQEYPALRVEVRIGDRYKPDVVALDADNKPIFWGESGRVGQDKIRSLLKRFPTTHFVMAKWDSSLAPYVEIVTASVKNGRREAPFDLICFPPDSEARFIDDNGHIHLNFTDVERVRLFLNPSP